MLHILRLFFSSRCRLFHNAIFFGSCNIRILYTGCAKILKKIPAPKGLNTSYTSECDISATTRIDSVGGLTGVL